MVMGWKGDSDDMDIRWWRRLVQEWGAKLEGDEVNDEDGMVIWHRRNGMVKEWWWICNEDEMENTIDNYDALWIQ